MVRNALEDITNVIRNGEAQVIKRSWKERVLVGHLDSCSIHIEYDMLPHCLVIKNGVCKPEWGAPYNVSYGDVELPKDSWYGEFMIQ